MMGRSHAVLGAVAGALAARYLAGATPGEVIVWAGVGAVAGLAPDIDHPHARLGRLLPGWWHRLTPGGHRGMTHSLVWVAGLGAILGVAAAVAGVPARVAVTLALVVTAGALSHLVGDGVTRQGVPWLWPWQTARYTLPVGWSIATGGLWERVIVALTVGVGVLLQGSSGV